MGVLTRFFLCLVLLIAAVTILLYSGWYNVAATEPHTALGTWILDTAKHRSVKVQADDVQITTQFTDGQIRRGFEHFRKTCVACHGAPGVERTEMGKGLRPQPRSEEHTSELQSLMRISYAVFCLKKKKRTQTRDTT